MQAVALEYLTVQDHLFINLQVSKKKNTWNFARLEEGVYFQYGYGGSTDLFLQAARYATGFPRKAPFDGSGNLATGFVGLIAFLALNGYALNVPVAEAAGWYRNFPTDAEKGKVHLQGSVVESGDHHPEVESVVNGVLTKYASAIESLVG